MLVNIIDLLILVTMAFVPFAVMVIVVESWVKYRA